MLKIEKPILGARITGAAAVSVRHIFAYRGFSLLELLVVMAAVTVLAGLMCAAANSAAEKGRQFKCMKNLREIGDGILNCAKEDPDLQLPQIYDLALQADGKWKLFSEFQHNPSDILSFVDPSVLQCPSDSNPSPLRASDANGNSLNVRCSYGFNFIPAIAGVRFTTVDPRTFLVFDGKCNSAAQNSHWTGSVSDVARLSSDLGSPRHYGKFNVFFLDGHCELLSALPASGVLP